MFDPIGRGWPGGVGARVSSPGILRYAKGRFAWVFVCSWMAISGCAATPGTDALPPPPDRVGVSAPLEPFAQAKIAAYARSLGVPPFDLVVWPAADALRAVEDGSLQLLVSAAPPPANWFATPLGFEEIAVIVSPTVRIRDLTLRQLGDVFIGAAQTWDEVDGPEEPIQLVIPPEGDELRGQFEMLVLNGGRFPRTALLAPTPEAMLSVVSDTAGAIGFLPFSYSAEGARVISIGGKLASPQNLTGVDYPLRFEVVATAPDEPQGGLRDWLAWLQQQE